MLNIKNIQCNMLAENCYIVSDETNDCIIIDCGAYSEMEKKCIEDYITEAHLTPRMHILTHGHFDHIMGSKWIYEKYGIKPTIYEADTDTYNNFNKDTEAFGFSIDYNLPAIGQYLTDGETIEFGTHSFKVTHTPGHSKGSVIYYCDEEKVVFTGDTLFKSSIGRTDLPGGSMFQIIQSLRKITQLPDDTKVYPGHGGTTTIGYELATNPYLDR